jgi:hypothetical protein
MVTTMEAAFASALAGKAGPTPADVSRLAVARGAHWRCTLRFADGRRYTAHGHTRDGAYLAAWRAAVGRDGRECPAISEVPLTAGALAEQNRIFAAHGEREESSLYDDPDGDSYVP